MLCFAASRTHRRWRPAPTDGCVESDARPGCERKYRYCRLARLGSDLDAARVRNDTFSVLSHVGSLIGRVARLRLDADYFRLFARRIGCGHTGR